MTPDIVDSLERAAALAYDHARNTIYPRERRTRHNVALRIERVLTHIRVTMRAAAEARSRRTPGPPSA